MKKKISLSPKKCKDCKKRRKAEKADEEFRKAAYEALKGKHQRYSCDPFTTCKDCL